MPGRGGGGPPGSMKTGILAPVREVATQRVNSSTARTTPQSSKCFEHPPGEETASQSIAAGLLRARATMAVITRTWLVRSSSRESESVEVSHTGDPVSLSLQTHGRSALLFISQAKQLRFTKV